MWKCHRQAARTRESPVARSARSPVWSYYLVFYGGIGERVRFIRVGTLDDPGRLPPDVHIYTSSKQPWLVLPEDALAVEEFYVSKEVWSKESLERLAALLNSVQG